MCNVGKVSKVTARASGIAETRLIRPIRTPSLAPHTAGARKRSKQAGEIDSTRKRDRQKIHGTRQETALTQSVRRETEPTAKPPVQDQPASSSACGTTDVHDAWLDT